MLRPRLISSFKTISPRISIPVRQIQFVRKTPLNSNTTFSRKPFSRKPFSTETEDLRQLLEQSLNTKKDETPIVSENMNYFDRREVAALLGLDIRTGRLKPKLEYEVEYEQMEDMFDEEETEEAGAEGAEGAGETEEAEGIVEERSFLDDMDYDDDPLDFINERRIKETKKPKITMKKSKPESKVIPKEVTPKEIPKELTEEEDEGEDELGHAVQSKGRITQSTTELHKHLRSPWEPPRSPIFHVKVDSDDIECAEAFQEMEEISEDEPVLNSELTDIRFVSKKRLEYLHKQTLQYRIWERFLSNVYDDAIQTIDSKRRMPKKH